MKTDKELLKLAAKAVCIELDYRHGSGVFYYDDKNSGREEWDPLDDDGQALRLAVDLSLHAVHHPALQQSIVRPYWCAEKEGETVENIEDSSDIYAATRRAIVRAAAAIGESMQ